MRRSRIVFQHNRVMNMAHLMIVGRAALLGLIVASMAVRAAAQTQANEQDTQSVQRNFEKYLESVKTADGAVASGVWSNAPETSAVTPFGRFDGWETVRDGIYVNFLQKAFSERRLQPSHVTIRVAGDTAWLVFDWDFTAKMSDGQPITTKGWESQVYRRTQAGWRIVHLHYSVPPPPPPR